MDFKADIRALVEVRKGQLDWETIERYASLLEARDILGEIRR